MNIKDIRIPPVHLILLRFFGRFHIVAFTIVVLGGLSITTYTLNLVIASTSEKDDDASTVKEMPNFDSTTIERVSNLSQSTEEVKSLDLPNDKRTNPFWE